MIPDEGYLNTTFPLKIINVGVVTPMATAVLSRVPYIALVSDTDGLGMGCIEWGRDFNI